MIDTQRYINQLNISLLCMTKESYADEINTVDDLQDSIKAHASQDQDDRIVDSHVSEFPDDVFVKNLVELREALKQAKAS